MVYMAIMVLCYYCYYGLYETQSMLFTVSVDIKKIFKKGLKSCLQAAKHKLYIFMFPQDPGNRLVDYTQRIAGARASA